ncbi:MAG: helix-turn-helix domain-containing protein, partial [Nanoarchaeota archaeon]|nr:helix-turn-helix domain-containing protein [Nanoarchaeota archaeon]
METKVSMLLKEYGLYDNEIKVYLFLVGNRETGAYKIAKSTRIHKSTCYDVLDRLISKGFVSRIEGKKTVYSANETSKILSSIKNKEDIILSIIPELEKIEKIQETRIKFLDTPESQREFDLNLLNLARTGRLSFVYVLSNGPS